MKGINNMEKHLTLEQNIRSAIIFLNIWGLKLEEKEKLNSNSVLQIYDQNNITVGEVRFDGNKTIMTANYNEINLEASYDNPVLGSLYDGDDRSILFGSWASNIFFEAKSSNFKELSGNFEIGCSIDSELGIKCNCRSLIKYIDCSDEIVEITLCRDGKMLGIKANTTDKSDVIDIMPWDDFNGFIVHDFRNNCENDNGLPIRLYARITKSPADDKNLRQYLHTQFKELELTWDELVPKEKNDDLIQKGSLMRQIDSSMFEKIREIRQKLMIGDVSFFANLISACYNDFSDEEIKMLIGVDKSTFTFQNSSNNLTHAYLGMCNEQGFQLTKKINE